MGRKRKIKIKSVRRESFIPSRREVVRATLAGIPLLVLARVVAYVAPSANLPPRTDTHYGLSVRDTLTASESVTLTIVSGHTLTNSLLP